jgi:predicted metal-dependent enzyme (double-stranded beta helix superfamily)
MPADCLQRFVSDLGFLLEQPLSERQLLLRIRSLMAELVTNDDWLPPSKALADSKIYQQHLLHCDKDERFSVVSFVWAPGQGTPIHNHTVWGAIGMLRGAECSQAYSLTADGLQEVGPEVTLHPGQVELVSPTVGDIHRVRNASADAPAISIHVYGGNIGKITRSVYDKEGRTRPFVSGYAS